jgi:hypothetical protein
MDRGPRSLAGIAVLAVAFACALPAAAGAATITVDTSSDVAASDGDCSLREAMTAANDDRRFEACRRGHGRDTIAFDIAGSELISLADKLPIVTAPVTIDGTTEPDFAGAPVVRLDGTAGARRGIRTAADNVVIRGLVLTSFGQGLRLDGDDGVVAGNLIGVDEGGAEAGNGRGIFVKDGRGNRIGGSDASDRNVLSANATGVYAPAPHTKIQGNYIGTDPSGTSARANGLSGVETSGKGNALIDNVISGNDGPGVFASGPTKLRGNIVGLRADETAALPNGTDPLSLGDDGILALSAKTTIGGPKAKDQNVIAGNIGDGVEVNGAKGVSILGNAIFDNGEEAIDLGGDGPTLNDVGSVPDSDNGPNHLQNFPDLIGGNEQEDKIYGSLDSTPRADFRIEFFLSPGTGDAQEYLGAKKITTNDSGHRNFVFSASTNLPTGQFVTATATRLNGGDVTDTSELSPSADVSLGP